MSTTHLQLKQQQPRCKNTSLPPLRNRAVNVAQQRPQNKVTGPPLQRNPVRAKIIGVANGKTSYYMINVTYKAKNWVVYHRFSQFFLLRQQLLHLIGNKKQCVNGGCSYLARLKLLSLPRFFIMDKQNSRIDHLTRMVELIASNAYIFDDQFRLRCSDHCLIAHLVKDFLGFSSKSKKLNTSTDFFSNNEISDRLWMPSQFSSNMKNKLGRGELYPILEEQVVHFATSV